MPSEREHRFAGPRRGQLVFALFLVAAALLLLALIGDQTTWVSKAKLFAQPRFWPAVAVGGMVLMGGLHLYKLPWRRVSRYDLREVKRWAQVLEFAGWFMGYVLLVPIIGYLPVTLAFMPLLSWRMGYRSRFMLWISAAFAVAVVVLFKAVLSVKIPGAMLYEYLPGPVRSFFILYL
ncbi:tripartite tricarboxylate transporter TctB family protein [Leisingera sp. HS039]|uniref:tripartite tricarboxylate transporter TctB family protein n=1 Tax=unclassified Leisingera TaxID=2614906 RepID=UPI0010708C31|nr:MULTISPECIES: tripartite tricarboxylate transporter TctB family protein [unclassified Leisingera]MBQ4827439.1 tripartite tricarboxylate transporter TctB family protein [Leisingera sp. HS039]QBR37357.1 tripartite tricarboxylate transporter TctB family protein [Leisingera sp. NJS201]